MHCSRLPTLRATPAFKHSWLTFLVLNGEITQEASSSTTHLSPNPLVPCVFVRNPVQLASSRNDSEPPLNPRLE